MDRLEDWQLDIFGGRQERPRKPQPAWQPGLFTAEHEAREAALERLCRLGRGEDDRYAQPPARVSDAAGGG
jgi:hypothetical protein